MKKLFFSKLSFKNTSKKHINIKEAFEKPEKPSVFSPVSRKKLSFRYTAALLIAMIIPMVFGFFTTRLAIDSAKNRILEKNNQAISHIQSSVDNDLRAIIEYMLSVANNQELLEVSKKPYSKDFIYQAASAGLFPEPDNLNSLDIISKSAIYFDNSEMVVSDKFVYHISAFFDEIVQPRDISYEQFLEAIKTTSNRKFTTATDCYFGKKTLPTECMIYIQSFPLTSAPSGKLIAFINCRQLVKPFLDSFENSDSCFFIADESGSVLYSVGNKELVSAEFSVAEANHGTMEIGGKDVLYSKKNSTYGNLKYIYTENAHNAVKDMAPLIAFTSIYVFLTLILGFAYIVWLADKKRRAVSFSAELTQDLSEAETSDELQSEAPDKDDSIYEEVKSLPLLDAEEQSARKNIISNILRGEFGNTEGIVEACKKNGINFITEDFCVIYFNLNEIIGPDIPIIKYAISNTVLEIFEPMAAVFLDDTEPSSMAGILNLKKTEEETEKQILNHLEFLRNFFTEQFAASINAGMGSVVKGVENIALSCSNAREAAEYSIITDSSDVLPYSRIKTKDYSYFYPLETESKLVSAVMNDDFEQVRQIIDHIVESNSMLSFDMYKYLFFDLTATALKIMSHKSIDISNIFGDSSSPFESITACKNIEELVETAHSIFRQICVDNKGGHSQRKEKLKASILEFIQKNYTNPNMSLAMVADEFSMNYTYASHFFKDFIGMNFIDYVSDLRVKKASELLRTTTMPIADIAAAVGYANSTVLIKIFKKITNTTPGAYRKNIY